MDVCDPASIRMLPLKRVLRQFVVGTPLSAEATLPYDGVKVAPVISDEDVKEFEPVSPILRVDRVSYYDVARWHGFSMRANDCVERPATTAAPHRPAHQLQARARCGPLDSRSVPTIC